MVKQFKLIFLLLLSFLFSYNTIAQKLGFNEVLQNKPYKTTTFCVPHNNQNTDLLQKENVHIKFANKNWLFITSTPKWIQEKYSLGELTNFYFEFAPPALLADSARAHHFVNEVHSGLGGLPTGYTGKGVIIGVVDTGIDYNHPDFLDSNNNTRVIRYWDQTMPDNASSPFPYGYGYAWDSTDINNGICTSIDTQAHGSTVAGQALGNAGANGQNKGMAPESSIIVVHTDFSRPNWTLTVADACDYIFRVADSLGMPAVVNLSLGSYLGSHDGNDPASEMMEDLLDEKPGRIIVSAAGNSGHYAPYHQSSNVTSDTNFVWFGTNTSNQFGANAIFFDLWTDMSDATFDFAIGADTEGPLWEFKGRTNFHGALSSLGTTIVDTIWNGSSRIATIEVYTEQIGNNLHFQVLAFVDSMDYRYRFETTGSGKYDLWSGAEFNLSPMYTDVPSSSVFPDSIYYVAPDKEQSIVSSWNCSEKVISVANFQNRATHIDKNLNNYPFQGIPVGQLSNTSSKGPNRNNLLKPNIAAAGNLSLCAGPLSLLSNPAANPSIDSNGWHVRNGGTSMASPIVAGIAALYLERCSRATYHDFMMDIQATAYNDSYTGATPNNAYGYGKIHALNTLLEQITPSTPTIVQNVDGQTLEATEGVYYEWYLNGVPISNQHDSVLPITPPYGTYAVTVYNSDGCSNSSSEEIVTLGLGELNFTPLKVHPNPTNGYITIELEENIDKVELVDLSGNIIEINSVSDNKINLSEISKGSYTLRIFTKKEIFYSKIVRL